MMHPRVQPAHTVDLSLKLLQCSQKVTQCHHHSHQEATTKRTSKPLCHVDTMVLPVIEEPFLCMNKSASRLQNEYLWKYQTNAN